MPKTLVTPSARAGSVQRKAPGIAAQTASKVSGFITAVRSSLSISGTASVTEKCRLSATKTPNLCSEIARAGRAVARRLVHAVAQPVVAGEIENAGGSGGCSTVTPWAAEPVGELRVAAGRVDHHIAAEHRLRVVHGRLQAGDGDNPPLLGDDAANADIRHEADAGRVCA